MVPKSVGACMRMASGMPPQKPVPLNWVTQIKYQNKPEGAKIEQIGNEKIRVVNKFFQARALKLAHGCIKANNYLAEQMPQALARQTGEKRRMESNMYWAQTSHGPKINSATSLTSTTIQTPLCMSCQHPFLPRMVV
ncbi:hypothetical protein PSHT_08329 [Puccinia striiformis]|uniref:Uncharacterized protein n=1 Tax=Puccinia striiformis TaxID=27350 RepID=A0A2S4VQ75_9BASI|nr:hypothetical protein PSHT_08329 [Puccinia striiformis]